MIKNLPASEGKASLIPGLGRSSGGGNGNPLQIFLPRKIPQTEELDGLWSKGLQRVGLVWAQQHNKDLCLQQTSQMKDTSYLVLGTHRFCHFLISLWNDEAMFFCFYVFVCFLLNPSS